jgi:NAD(P)H-nitrite reductase large subunit
MNIVIIGSSAASKSAVETLISYKENSHKITVITRDEKYYYSRVLLPNYIAGVIEEADLYFVEKDFLNHENLKVIRGVAEVIDTEGKQIKVEGHGSIPYDKLIISTGAFPKNYELKNSDVKGIYNLRDFEDALDIKSRALQVEDCAVIGGGLVGLKAAWALKELGKNVTIIQKSDQILSAAIDKKGGDIVKSILENNGINVMLNNNIEEFVEKDGFVTGVKLQNGDIIHCGLVVVGTGVAPDLDLISGTSIETGYGIIVDTKMQTSVADIYAAGDVAQSKSLLSGGSNTFTLWPDAITQGKIAALDILGIEKEYVGGISMNSVVFYDIPIISIGLIKDRDTKNCEIYTSSNAEKNLYKKIVVRDRKIVGAILVGDVSFAGMIHWDIKSGKTVEDPSMYLSKQGLEDIYIERYQQLV